MGEVKQVNMWVERSVGLMQASWLRVTRAILVEGETVGLRRTIARVQWF
jgi:hypothetical protein